MFRLLVAFAVIASSWLVMPAAGEPIVTGSKVELFVSDAAASTDFYALLGFEVAARKDDGYTTLRNGSVVLALSPVPGWAPLHWFGFLRHPPLGTELVFYTGQLETMHEAFEAAGHSPGPIAVQPWGDRDFRIQDRDGYYIRVSEGVAVRTQRPAEQAD